MIQVNVQSNHKIASLQLNVVASQQSVALSIRQDLKNSWQQLEPIFNAELNQLNLDKEWLHLNKLTINVRVGDIDELSSQVSKELSRQLAQLTLSSVMDNNQINQDKNSLRFSDHFKKIDDIKHSDSKPSSLSDLDVICFYQLNGCLPWFIDASMFEEILNTNISRYHFQLLEIAYSKNDLAIWYRTIDLLLIFCDVDWQNELIDLVICPDVIYMSDIFHKILSELVVVHSPSVAKSLSAVSAVISLLLVIDQNLFPQFSHEGMPASSLLDIIDWDQLVKVVPNWILQEQRLIFEYDNPDNNTEKTDVKNNVAPNDKLGHAHTSLENQFSVPSKSFQKSLESDSEDTINKASVSFAVDHAGMVLLAPFLGKFFESRGIEFQNNKIAYRSLPRAALLLYAISTGLKNCYEYELGFLKVLLGLNLDDPVLVSKELLSESDINEIDNLIQAVIKHWAALGNISIAGFRSSFLYRSGVLEQHNDSWVLNFERVGHDILIDRLPWTLQWVNLPWMKKPINVNW